MLIYSIPTIFAKKYSITASGSICDYTFVSGNDVDDLLCFIRQHWANDTIPPKLHLLENHAADFIERWSTGHGIYGEHREPNLSIKFSIY